MGAFGQFCVVMPDQDVVIAITAGTVKMNVILDALWSILLPALDHDVPSDPKLLAKLSTLQIPPPTGNSREEAPSPDACTSYSPIH